MNDKQHYGVCCGNEIKAVYKDYDKAIEESTMWTMETGVQHIVKPVKKKG